MFERRIAAVHTHARQYAFVGHFDVGDRDLVRAGTGQPADVPCVEDLEVRARHDGVHRGKVRNRHAVAPSLHQTREYAGVVTTADELPAPVHAESARPFRPRCRSRRSNRTESSTGPRAARRIPRMRGRSDRSSRCRSSGSSRCCRPRSPRLRSSRSASSGRIRCRRRVSAPRFDTDPLRPSPARPRAASGDRVRWHRRAGGSTAPARGHARDGIERCRVLHGCARIQRCRGLIEYCNNAALRTTVMHVGAAPRPIDYAVELRKSVRSRRRFDDTAVFVR